MTKYYQVNQSYRDHHEFKNEYLCAPDSGIWHHELMKKLNIGDIIFHYYSGTQKIFGISKVKIIQSALIKNFQNQINNCCLYKGQHLSYSEMTSKQRQSQIKYSSFLVVHVEKVIGPISLGSNFFPKEQIYLKEINVFDIHIFDPILKDHMEKNVITKEEYDHVYSSLNWTPKPKIGGR